MNAADVVGYVADGEAICLFHAGPDAELDKDGEVYSPVLAGSEWDSYPVCSYCSPAQAIEDVELTSAGERWKAMVYDTYVEPFPDRDDLVNALQVFAYEHHSGQFSRLYRLSCFLYPRVSYRVRRDGFGGLNSNALMYYRKIHLRAKARQMRLVCDCDVRP
jgi:hypothetical protein